MRSVADMSVRVQDFERRVASVRDALRGDRLDALVVTHGPNVRYLTGFSGSAGVAIVTSGAVLLLVDFRYATAARDLLARQASRVQLESIDASYDTATVEVLQRLDVRRAGIEAAWMSVARFTRISAALASGPAGPWLDASRAAVLVPTERIVERIRAIKDDAEIAVIREAARRIADVARALPDFVTPGRTEAQVAAEIDAAIRRAGFERPAFETIVASGPNSALPHARPGKRVLIDGDGVVLDFGGVYDGYCVDLTRTVAIGRPTGEFRRLFAAVHEAHEAALASVRPGVRASDVDGAARRTLERHGLGEAFGHGTGHGLGLEVHEEPRVGRVIAGQPDAVIEAGMVFTIEPGAYLAGVGGVRIEDDVLVVDGGCERLTEVPVALEIRG